MISWIIHHGATVILCALLCAGLGWSIASMVKKKGKTCGCGCAGCTGGAKCGKETKKKGTGGE